MNKITYEDFQEQGGNPMAGAAADEIQYYRVGDALGFIGEYGDEVLARVLRPAAAYDGQYRVDGSSRFSGGSAQDKAEDWLSGQ